MTCAVFELVVGARNARIAFEVVERLPSGKLGAVDLTQAATPPGFVEALFRKPSGEIVLKTCAVEAPASAGIASYATEDGFLDEIGTWQANALVHLQGSGTGRGFFPSRIVEFQVLELVRPFAGLATATPAPLAVDTNLPAVLVA